MLLILLIGAYGVYQYAYQSHPTIESLATNFKGISDDFKIKIQENSEAWQNKIVELTGKVTSKDSKGITLSESIYCQFRDPLQSLKGTLNSEITIKGRVIGYDDLLEELKLDQCIIQH